MRAILTYHSIDDSGSPISLGVKQFERHVRWLASGEIRVTTVDEILDGLDRNDHAVALTFDDGLDNFRERAWPLLRDLGLPVTLAVVTERVGGWNDWKDPWATKVPRTRLLDWDALGSLAAEGVSLAAHSRSHRALPALDPHRLEEEVGGSADEIESHLGFVPNGFVYPYGLVDKRSSAVAARFYQWACTTAARALHPRVNHYLVPRLDAVHYRGASRLESWGTPAFMRHLAARRLSRSLGSLVRRRTWMAPQLSQAGSAG